jgi:hypothetical protein
MWRTGVESRNARKNLDQNDRKSPGEKLGEEEEKGRIRME